MAKGNLNISEPTQTGRFSRSGFRPQAAKESTHTKTKQETNKKLSTPKPGIGRCEDNESNCSEEIIEIFDDSDDESNCSKDIIEISSDSDDESNFSEEIREIMDENSSINELSSDNDESSHRVLARERTPCRRYKSGDFLSPRKSGKGGELNCSFLLLSISHLR